MVYFLWQEILGIKLRNAYGLCGLRRLYGKEHKGETEVTVNFRKLQLLSN